MRQVKPYVTAFFTGGTVYAAAEIAWRGFTHWSMFFTGGVCLAGLYRLRQKMQGRKNILFCVAGGVWITAVEFLVGCTVNLLLGWQVWDYSHVFLNLLGQICLPYTLLWMILSYPAGRMCDKICGYFSRSTSKTRQSGSPTTL